MSTCAQCAVANDCCEIITSPSLQLCSHLTSVYNFSGKQYFVRYQMRHCDSLRFCRQQQKKTLSQYYVVDQKTLPVGFGGWDFVDSGSQIQLQMLVNITYSSKIGQLVLFTHYFQVKQWEQCENTLKSLSHFSLERRRSCVVVSLRSAILTSSELYLNGYFNMWVARSVCLGLLS